MKLKALASLFLFTISSLSADMTNQYNQQIDVIASSEGSYKSVEIFAHKDGISVLALCSLKDSSELRLFSYNGISWSVSTKTWEPPNQHWYGLVANNRLQVYSIKQSTEEEMATFHSLESTNMLSENPEQTISLSGGNKHFPGEVSRRYLRILMIEENEFFIVGEYTESKMNIVTFFGALLSGGHSGYAKRLFGMRMHQNQILGQYNIPEKIQNNDFANLAYTLKTPENIFVGWIKGREYSFGGPPLRWKVARYDLSENRWCQPIELFRGGDRTNKAEFYYGPILTVDQENVLHSIWSYTTYRHKSPETTSKGSGIYYRTGNQILTERKTVTDSISTMPRIVADRKGEVHVFWTQNNVFGTQESGLFYWQPNADKIDRLISEPQVGLLDVAVCDDNAIHVVYIKFNDEFPETSLEYIKFVGCPMQNPSDG